MSFFRIFRHSPRSAVACDASPSFVRRHGLFLFLALGLTALASQAQTPSPASSGSARLRFLFLDESPGAYFVKLPKGYQQLSAAPYVVGPAFTSAGAERLDLYKTSPAADPVTGKVERVKIASFTPPPGPSSSLVIITPKPAQAGALPVCSVEVIDSSVVHFPLGSVRILNVGRVAMAAQFGTSQIVVQPGSSKVIQPVPDRRYRIFAKVAAQAAESWELRSDTLVVLRPEQRITGIFFYSPSGMIHTYPPEEIAERGPPPPGHFWITFSDPP